MEKDLLTAFIEERLKAYEEPTRKGTPRGEPIGFGKKKYKATLYMLQSGSFKDMLIDVDISYGLLRKWKTEDAFRERVIENQKEFIIFFMDSIASLKEEFEKKLEMRCGRSLKEIAKDPNPIPVDKAAFEKFTRCPFDLFLFMGILRKLADIVKQKKDALTVFIAQNLYYMLSEKNEIIIDFALEHGFKKEDYEKWGKEVERRGKENLKDAIKNLKKVTLNLTPTIEDRKKALMDIGFIEYATKEPLTSFTYFKV